MYGDPREAWLQSPDGQAYDAKKKAEEQAQKEMAARERQRQMDRSMTPGFEKQFGRLGDLERGFERRPTQYSDFRLQQGELGKMLANEARGQGIGQQLVRQQAQGMADRGVQQQYGMAAGARPGQSALATRQAAMQTAGIQGQAAGQAAMAGGQMQLGAMGQYGQFLQGARGQDEDTRLRQLGLNDQSQLEALRQRLQLSGMQQQGGQFYNSLQEQKRQYDASRPSNTDKALGVFSAAAPILGAALAGPPGAAAGDQAGRGVQQQQQQRPQQAQQSYTPYNGFGWT
jgi:hypothetical protein